MSKENLWKTFRKPRKLLLKTTFKKNNKKETKHKKKVAGDFCTILYVCVISFTEWVPGYICVFSLIIIILFKNIFVYFIADKCRQFRVLIKKCGITLLAI